MRRTWRRWIQWSDTGCACPVGCSTLVSRRRRGNSNLVWVEAGKVIDGVLVTGRQEDARNLQALLSVAQIRIVSGDTSATTVYRDKNNVDHELTPPQIVNLFLQSSAYVTEVYAASWPANAPIPK